MKLETTICKLDGTASTATVTGLGAAILAALIDAGPAGRTADELAGSRGTAGVYITRLRAKGFDIETLRDPASRCARYVLVGRVDVRQARGGWTCNVTSSPARRRQLARRITALGTHRLDLLFDDIAAACPRLDELLERHARTADLAGATP